MPWYHFVAAFFAGAFLANAVPHFVKGICGDRFPSPFGKPPGKGLSSPITNVVWGLFNIVVGYILFSLGEVSSGGNLTIIVFFIGAALMSLMMSVNFSKKDAS